MVAKKEKEEIVTSAARINALAPEGLKSNDLPWGLSSSPMMN